MSNNTVIFTKGLTNFSIDIEKKIIEVLDYVAQDIILFIEGSPDIPVLTGNLRDSTGLGIYHHGILTRYEPLNTAVIAQKYKGNQIWGFQELDKVYTYGATLYSKGIWLVLFSSVPYAISINEKKNYFDDQIVKQLKSIIMQQIIKLQ